MDELTEKLSSLLQDPAGMERIKEMAEGLFSSGGVPEPEKQNPSEPEIDISAISRIMGMMKSGRKDDERVQLLLALKPNLSPERQARVDSAVKILKLIDLAPLLKEAGLFNL